MTPTETAAILRQFNEWRRGDEDIPQFDPRDIGEAIDAAVEMIDRLEAAERERDAAELMSLALRAKIEQMERQKPVATIHINSITGNPSVDFIPGHQYLNHNSSLYALPGAKPPPSVPDTYAAGINAVAAMLQSKADEYAKEHGHDDMGGLSFGPGMGGEIKMDYYTNLIELVDDVRAMLAAAPSVPDDVVEQAVNRFLSWKLPKDFHPDGGMVFIPTKGRGYDSPHWPAGTNLLNAQQAREMLRYVLAAAPEAKP